MSTVPDFTNAPSSPAMTGPEFAWEIARLFPQQGRWSVEEYLDLTDSTNNFVEYYRGRIEVLEMPTLVHQKILLYLLDHLRAFVSISDLGLVMLSPLRVKVAEDVIREPDILFVSHDNDEKIANRYFFGADLVMEIVSEGSESRKRDYEEKRSDYAQAGIAEYWIVDPKEKKITVLSLNGEEYSVHGEYKPGELATSVLLKGFQVDAKATFDAGEFKKV